ncbi:MAG: rhodanese-like domain-containing protein [Alphaproteobacteria bacterium]|nr:MAG: rhodanese-like domain-containing protein [Alphaproteobacteria bacterium]
MRFKISVYGLMLALCLFPAVSHAQQEPVQALTLDQFKEALPSHAEELHLKEFLALKQKEEVVVLDVRSKESYAYRHLAGSVNIPLTDLTEKILSEAVPDKDTPVVLACDYSFFPTRMIAMTMQAYPVLKANGYTKIYRLNLWSSADGKMVSDEEQEKRLVFEGTSVDAQNAE